MAQEQQERRSIRTAGLVAEVLAPAPLVLALFALAGWVGAGWSGLGWGLGTAVLVATVPMTGRIQSVVATPR